MAHSRVFRMSCPSPWHDAIRNAVEGGAGKLDLCVRYDLTHAELENVLSVARRQEGFAVLMTDPEPELVCEEIAS